MREVEAFSLPAGVAVGTGVGVVVAVSVGVGVAVGVPVGVAVEVPVGVAVRVAVDVGVAVAVCVGVPPRLDKGCGNLSTRSVPESATNRFPLSSSAICSGEHSPLALIPGFPELPSWQRLAAKSVAESWPMTMLAVAFVAGLLLCGKIRMRLLAFSAM